MWTYFIIIFVSIIISAISLFSGFGLGTVLLPVFIYFFPLPLAISAVAVVHLGNNIFKSILVGRKADWQVVLRFAVPGAIAAILGALALNLVSGIPAIHIYYIDDFRHEVHAIKLLIGILIILFSLFDIIPRFKNISFNRKYLVLGGAISGFFGGLSGIQGAWRSAFLVKTGLDKDAFIGTVSISSVIVDFFRLIVYGLSFYALGFNAISREIYSLVAVSLIAASAGSILGALMIKKITLRIIKMVVGIMLIIMGIAISLGLL